MGEVLEAFGDDMNFKIHYIANLEKKPAPKDKAAEEAKDSDSAAADAEPEMIETIKAMHGQSEVDENIRWMCAEKHFPKDYLKYIWCRAEDYRNNDWKKCATGPIKAAVIEKCQTGGEGEALLKEDIAIGNALGIGASPTWVVNGRTKFSGVTPKVIQDNFCKANPSLKDAEACTKPLSNERASKAPAGACGQ